MKSIQPIDDQLEYILQTRIQENLRKIRRLKKSYRLVIKTILPVVAALRLDDSLYNDDGMFAGQNDIDKLVQDVTTKYNYNVREVVLAITDICSSVIQLGNTIDLESFSKRDIKEKYYSMGYLRCFSDIYQKFNELRGKI